MARIARYFLVLIGCVTSVSHAQGKEMGVYFTTPTCGSYSYFTPIKEKDGDIRPYKHGNLYCTPSDFVEYSPPERGFERKLGSLITDGRLDIEEIDMVYQSFWHPQFVNAICARAARDDFRMRVVIQKTGRSTSLPLKKLEACLGKNLELVRIGCDAANQQCPSAHINTLYSKLLVIRGIRGGGAHAYSFAGSSNLTRGLRANIGSFQYADVMQDSELDRAHRCMVDGLIQFAKKTTTQDAMLASYQRCTGSLTYKDGVEPYFLPMEFDRYKSKLLAAIKMATAIEIAAQKFKDKDIINAILDAQRRKIPVRLITDDRWHYTAITYRNEGSYHFRDYASFLLPFVRHRTDIRYLETNSDLNGIRNNVMNLRFMVVHEGARKTVFEGAGQSITDASDNSFDNQYVITQPELVRAYQNEFESLWTRGVAQNDMPTKHVLTSFAKFDRVKKVK